MAHSTVRYVPQHAPLWKVFWLYGVIPSNLLWALVWLMIRGNAATGAISAMFVVLLAYTAWIVLAVWRCADNVQKPVYGVMARWLTVAWAINTVLFVFFLQLDLLS
jgi:hypothetical protein